ncbi:sigma 54-interacting transcriptional regulator, partial [Desulfosporosinus burensis]
MPLHVQSKLLRVLENHSIERIGGVESITTNVRIIAATHRNLEEMVERSEFRGDLYYRLSVIPIFIPSLKERKQDIPLFISYFLEKYGSIMDRPIQELDATT